SFLSKLTRHILGVDADQLLAIGCRVIRRVQTNESCLALTFDDGPSPAGTEKILDVLDSFKIPATFYLIGANAQKYPQLAKRISASQHEIGSHGFAHLNYHRSLPHQVFADVKRGGQVLLDITGMKPRTFRAPFGRFRLDTRMAFGTGNLIGWDIAPAWNETSAEALAAYVNSRIQPGSIVLLHDGFGLSHEDPHGYVRGVTDALPMIIEYALAQGYQLCTVSNLLERCPSETLFA
ncbi:MAG: polysaccharide deacetylase family protein, partial [Bdellovibrionales bacterium]|nr:polysaccharide deacetylase family protein [Bdellovibrionales bacterium]